MEVMYGYASVSYTHLDVYKRQRFASSGRIGLRREQCNKNRKEPTRIAKSGLHSSPHPSVQVSPQSRPRSRFFKSAL